MPPCRPEPAPRDARRGRPASAATPTAAPGSPRTGLPPPLPRSRPRHHPLPARLRRALRSARVQVADRLVHPPMSRRAQRRPKRPRIPAPQPNPPSAEEAAKIATAPGHRTPTGAPSSGGPHHRRTARRTGRTRLKAPRPRRWFAHDPAQPSPAQQKTTLQIRESNSLSEPQAPRRIV